MSAMKRVPIFAEPKYHRRLACVPDSQKRAMIESLKADLVRSVIRRFPALIPLHRRDAYDTFRSASAPRTSSNPGSVNGVKVRVLLRRQLSHQGQRAQPMVPSPEGKA